MKSAGLFGVLLPKTELNDMNGGYSTQGKEETFIRKTLEILNQYEKLMSSFELNERYELTLYLNCLLGLIVIPQQSLLKGNTIIIKDQALWGVDLSQIKFLSFFKMQEASGKIS